jgi:hypothetical protein
MNIQKIRNFINEIIDALLYPILIEKNENAASHHCDFANKNKKMKPTTSLNPRLSVIPAEKFQAMLAKTNGTTPAQSTNRQPETKNRPNIHIGMIRADKFNAMQAKKGNSPTKQAIRQTEKFTH